MEIKSFSKRINRVLTLVLTITALMAGQTAWADANTSTDGVVTVPDIIVKSVIDVSALASWTACDGVSSYTLQLASDDQFTTGSSGDSGEILTETFDNVTFSPAGNSYVDQTILDGDLGTWTATESRGDREKPVFRANGTLTSPTIANGVAAVEFDYDWPLNESGSCEIELYVGGTLIDTELVIGGTVGTATYTLDYPVAGPTTIEFLNKASSNKRIRVTEVRITTPSSGSSGYGSLISETSLNTNEYTFTGLFPQTTYFARVKGDDDWSNVKEFQTLSVKATHPETWTDVQTALNAASTDSNDPTILILAADITASASNSYLDLPSGRHVILDLNGHTIDRALNEGTDNGYVLKVNNNSTLTIRDSAGGGTITGGWNTNGPGCITVYSSATLRLESGTISGNRVNIQGGSAISSSGTVYITDGTITDNWSNITCYNSNMCGTFYFSGGGTLYMSGGTISGNRCGSTTYGAAGIGVYLGMGSPNIHLSGTYNISGNMQGVYDEQTGEWSNLTPSDVLNTDRTTYHIDDPISPTAPAAMILYTYGNKTTFTNGWSTYMNGEDPEDYFTLANPNGQGIGLNSSGEATIGTLHTVTLADGLTASATQAAPGRPITLSGGAPSVSRYVVTYNDGEAHTDRYAADSHGNATFQMPNADASIRSEAAVTYIDADGIEQTCTDFTLIESHEGNVELGNINNNENWYAVNGPVTINGQLIIKDKNIHLILCDGASLTVNCATMHAIWTSFGNLTIYGQSVQSGTITATTTNDYAYGICGGHNITINGGTVNATSNSVSAILSLDDVIINGGTVTASGYYGINASDNVIINGGTVTAHCSNNYYAIYGGNNVTINGGIINADSPNEVIYAKSGTLTLGWTNASDRITASSYYSYEGTVSVKAGQAFYDGTDYYTGTLSTDQINNMAGKTLQPAVTYSITLPEHVSVSGTVTRLNGTTYAPAGATVTLSTETGNILCSVTVNGTPATDNGDSTWSFIMPAQDVTVAATVSIPPVTYIDADGTEQSCTYYTLLTSDDDISNAMVQGYLPGGWYVVDGDIDFPYLQFSGDVHIILADGARLNVDDGIYCYGYDLTIYRQAAGSGELTGRFSIYCNNICINGGTINIDNSNNAGIQADGNVTINGGTINIKNGNNYGIQADGNVTINGGTINIENSNIAGIQADGNVTINGGTLSFILTYDIWASNVILASSTSLKTLNITNGIYVYKISLDRTFTVGKPATVMLPFDMGVNAISGGTFYTFGGVEKENDRWVATMNAVTDKIEPNTPYLVMPTETSLRFTHETHLCTEGGGGGQTADEGSNWTFKGTYDYIKWTTDTSDPDYTAERAAEIGRVYGFAGVQKEGIEVGDFVKVASGARIRPMSAYLMWSDTPNAQNAPMRGSSRTGSAQELPQSITVRLLDASGTVTNVGEIDTVTGEISFEGWYTLQGVKLEAEPTEPGIYINNGKTVSIQK